MKKLFVIILGLLLLTSFVVAQGQGVHDPGTGIENPEIKDAGQGSGQGLQGTTDDDSEDFASAPYGQQVKAQNMEQFQQNQEEMQQLMAQEMNGFDEDQQKVYQNQNQVRLAVHSFLALENLTGDIGPQVSEIAKEFDNSVQKTIQAEEQIQKRGQFMRFLAGGDEEAADELIAEVEANQLKLQELKQLHLQCNADQEACDELQLQIQNMEQEQERLRELANSEKGKKGAFGWIWK